MKKPASQHKRQRLQEVKHGYHAQVQDSRHQQPVAPQSVAQCGRKFHIIIFKQCLKIRGEL